MKIFNPLKSSHLEKNLSAKGSQSPLQNPALRQQDLDRINLAINNNLDKKSHLSAMMSRVPMDFDGTEKLATMSSLNVANVSLHAQSIFNTVEKMKLEADKKSLESGGESSFSDESFIRFKQGEKAMLNVFSRYNFKKDEQTALPDHGLAFNLENLKEIDAAAKDMVKNIPMGDERELFGLYFQRVSAAVKNKTYTSYEKEFNQIKAVVDKVEDTKTKTKGGSLGAAIGLPLPGDKAPNAGLGVKLGFNKYNYLTTGMDSTYFIGNLNEFSTGANLKVNAKVLNKGVHAQGNINVAYTKGDVKMWNNLDDLERKFRQIASDNHKQPIAETLFKADKTVTEKEFDKAVQQSSDNHSRLSSLFRDAAGVEPKILNPDVKRSTGWDIDFDSLEVKAGYGGGVNIFADVGNSSSAKILTAYMYYWDPLSFSDALDKKPALLDSMRKEGLTAFSDQYIGQDKQDLGQKQLTNKATEGLDLLDKLANTYYGLVKEINRQSFSESNHLVGKNSQQDTKAIVNEVLDRLQIPVKQSWVNEQAKKGDAIDVLSKLKGDCQHKLNAEAVNHHHFTIALMRASYGHLAHTLNENDQSGKVLERFKALEKSLNQPPVEHSLKRLNRGAAFKHVNDMPYSSLKMSSTNSVSEAGVQVMREDSQLIRNTNFWYNKLRCGTQLDKNVKYTANISTQEAADRITGAVGGIAETLGVSAGYQGSYGREEQERTIMPYWAHERSKNNEALKDLDFSMKRVRTHTNHGPYAGGQVSVAPTVSLNASVNQSDSMVKTKNQTFGPTGAVYMMMLQMKNLANPGQDANRIRNIAEKNMDETVNALKGIANNSFARATFDSMQDSVLEYYRGSLVSEAKKDLKDIQGVGGNAMRNTRAALKASLNGAESKENKLKALNNLREGLKEGLPISETYLPPSSRKSFFSLARLFLSGRKVDDMNYLNMKSKAEVASDGANVIEQYINQDHKASRNPLSLSSAKKNVAKAEKTLDDLIDSMDYMQRKGALKDLIQQSVGNEDEKAELLETLARVKTSKNPEQKDVQQLMKAIKNAEDSGDPAFNKAHQREALNTSYESLLNQVQTLQQDDNANNRKATMDAFFDHSKNLEKFFKSAVYDPYRVDTYKSSQRQIAMFGNTLMSKIAHSVMDPLAAKIKAQPKLDSPLLLGGSASESQLSEVSQAEFDRAKMQALFKEKPIIPHGEGASRAAQFDSDSSSEFVSAPGSPAEAGYSGKGKGIMK